MSNTDPDLELGDPVEPDVQTPREDGAERATHIDDLPGDEGSKWQPGEPVEADILAGEEAARQREEQKAERDARRRDAELRRAAEGDLVSQPSGDTAAAAAAAAARNQSGPNGEGSDDEEDK